MKYGDIEPQKNLNLPNQTSFCVTKSVSQDNIAINSNEIITFDTKRYDIGSNFTSNTFTAPITGKYLFVFSINFDQIDIDADYYIVNIVTTGRNYAFLFDPGVLSGDPVYWSVSHMALCDMDIGDTVYLIFYQANGAQQTDIRSTDTYFSGCLLS